MDSVFPRSTTKDSSPTWLRPVVQRVARSPSKALAGTSALPAAVIEAVGFHCAGTYGTVGGASTPASCTPLPAPPLRPAPASTAEPPAPAAPPVTPAVPPTTPPVPPVTPAVPPATPAVPPVTPAVPPVTPAWPERPAVPPTPAWPGR